MRKLAVLLWLLACTNPIDATAGIEARAQFITAPPTYELWWSELEACSGIQRDFSAVNFYVVPNAYQVTVGGVSYWGYWIRKGNKIIMADAWMSSEKWVKHEEMHALLQRSDHPIEYFDGNCGDLT